MSCARDLQGAETHKETIGSQNREIVRLVAELRRLRDQKDAVKSLSGEGYRLRVALNVSEAQKDKLKARLTKLRATGATLSKLSSDEAAQLRTALRRSRRQKATIVKRLSILTPDRRAKLTPLSGTAEVVPVVNRGDPRGFV